MLIVEPEATKLPRRKRRSWTREETRRIVDESLMDGASIAEIARRHDLNANQLFTWRRQFGFELDTASVVTTMLPVTITPECEMETGSGGVSQMDTSKNLWANQDLIDSICRVAEERRHGRSIPGTF